MEEEEAGNGPQGRGNSKKRSVRRSLKTRLQTPKDVLFPRGCAEPKHSFLLCKHCFVFPSLVYLSIRSNHISILSFGLVEEFAHLNSHFHLVCTVFARRFSRQLLVFHFVFNAALGPHVFVCTQRNCLTDKKCTAVIHCTQKRHPQTDVGSILSPRSQRQH